MREVMINKTSNKISKRFTSLFFASLVIFMSCGDDNKIVTKQTNAQLNATILNSSSWSPSGASNVTFGGQQEGEWSDFVLNFAEATEKGGTFTTDGVPKGYEAVWATSGSWEFVDSNGTSINRNDDVKLNITVEKDLLTLSFKLDRPSTSARTTSVFGETWNFTLVPKAN